MTIHFNFNLDKALNTISLIFFTFKIKEIDASKLLRYLYLIERCALRDFDYPIIGGINILNAGTLINEDLYKVIHWHHKIPENVARNQEIWDRYCIVNRNEKNPKIKIRNNALYTEQLNENEYSLIRHACDYLEGLKLEDVIFDYPELKLLKCNYQYLDNVELLKILGKTDEEIEEIKLVSERENYLDQLLGDR